MGVGDYRQYARIMLKEQAQKLRKKKEAIIEQAKKVTTTAAARAIGGMSRKLAPFPHNIQGPMRL